MINITISEMDALETASMFQIKSADYLEASEKALMSGFKDHAVFLSGIAERWNRLAMHMQTAILLQRGLKDKSGREG
jgi:2-iminoacetate synthase ThiH